MNFFSKIAKHVNKTFSKQTRKHVVGAVVEALGLKLCTCQRQGTKPCRKPCKARSKKTHPVQAKTSTQPRWKQALTIAMGDSTMSAQQVLDALTSKGWAPTNKNPKQYISMMLSSNKKNFVCVSRGQYQVIPKKKS